MTDDDHYKTIGSPAEGLFRDKGSRFIAFAFHVENEDEIREHLAALRKKYHDATHHCYAWRLGVRGELSRANDDGEPSGSAGRPILGQLLSYGLTYVLVVVVRYFGGTLLGVPGLINAYRSAAVDAIENSGIIVLADEVYLEAIFPYTAMDGVMKVVKNRRLRVAEQQLDNLCRIVLAVHRGEQTTVADILCKIDGVRLSVPD